MLPQLPFDVPLSLPMSFPPELPSLPTSFSEVPEGLSAGSSWAWVLAGAAVAVVSLWALRRARRMVMAATVGVAGLLIAWNAGFLPLSA
jgi:hypothetical protein